MSANDQYTGPRKGLVLTDDEVIALGARSERPWPSPIITIDVTDEPEVRRATERGARSLIARGLLGVSASDSIEAGIQEILLPVLEGDLRVGTYFVDSNLAFAPQGSAIAAYASTFEPWTSEIIAPNGLHYLQQEPSDKVLEIIRAFLETSYTSGISRLTSPGGPEPAFVCAMRRWSADEIRVVAFRQDAAFRQNHPLNESERPDEVLAEFESLESALNYLGL